VATPRAFCSADGTGDCSFLGAVETAVLFDAVADYGGEKMCSGYVHVGKICAVGLVHVVVCFEEGRASGCYDGLEKRVRRDWSRLEVYLVYESAEET
jgi:hypothetical protein